VSGREGEGLEPPGEETPLGTEEPQLGRINHLYQLTGGPGQEKLMSQKPE
jgi:hypothetical protein